MGNLGLYCLLLFSLVRFLSLACHTPARGCFQVLVFSIAQAAQIEFYKAKNEHWRPCEMALYFFSKSAVAEKNQRNNVCP